MLHVEQGLFAGNGRADFEHVGTDDQFIARREVIGVILHERGATRQSVAHDLGGAQQGSRFPVAFGTKAEALLHQALAGEARQLRNAVEVFKRGGKGAEAACDEKILDTQFDFCCIDQVLALCAARFHDVSQFVSGLVFLNELGDVSVGNGLDRLDEIAHGIAVDRVAELDLC